ncbi:hypothetical protein C8R44DRAFT_852822 [Mycena epipterygia]|nr:hypothetical protein C8R44DRAFT_852822 [Mycena epipterygia]
MDGLSAWLEIKAEDKPKSPIGRYVPAGNVRGIKRDFPRADDALWRCRRLTPEFNLKARSTSLSTDSILVDRQVTSLTLRDRLAELDAQIYILEAERKIIRRKMRAISYPVLELPPEITSEIFLHCLPNLPSDPSPLEAPLLLLGICGAWREIALQTPALWASFRVSAAENYAPLPTAFQEETGRKRLSDWLRRAGSASLDLEIICGPSAELSASPDPPSPDMPIELFDHAPHWHDVDISFQDLSQVHRIVSAFGGKLNTLERFSLNVWYSGSLRNDLLVTGFAQAPNLREVSLADLRFANIILPWAQLTSLTINDGFSVPDCLQVLQLSPRLTSCELDNINETGELENLALLPPLPNLKALLLDCDSTVHILHVLTLPGLTTLRLPWQIDEYVIPFLSRSSPVRLQKLFLVDYYHFLSDALPLIPALADIEINDLGPEEVTEFLQILRDSAAQATHLRSITIHVIDVKEDEANILDYHVLVATLVALKDHALQAFRLTWQCDEDAEDRLQYSEEEIGVRPDWISFQQLSDLAEDGMHIYLGIAKNSWM